MARQERWYYKNDPKYSAEDIEKLDKALKKEDRITAIFVPIVSVLFIFMIPIIIFDIIFHIKGLEIALYVMLVLFFISLLLWFVFYYLVSQERAKVFNEVEAKFKDQRKAH